MVRRMTLGELVETCGHIGLIEATVRGTSKSEYERVCEYRIGARADYYPGDYRATWPNTQPDPTIHLIQKPIHVRDAGAASNEFGQIMKNIPTKIRNLQVMLWTIRKEYGAPWNRAGTDSLHLRCDLRSEAWVKKLEQTSKPIGHEAPEKVIPAAEPAEEDENQISLFEEVRQ